MPDASQHNPAHERDDSPCRVLVVDDDPTVRKLVRIALTEDGFDVTVAADGAEAILCLQRERFNVIVLDLDMPVMDGRAFWRRIKEAGEDIPTLVLSALDARPVAEELGAAAALDKPFDLDELTDTISRLCEESHEAATAEQHAETNGTS